MSTTLIQKVSNTALAARGALRAVVGEVVAPVRYCVRTGADGRYYVVDGKGFQHSPGLASAEAAEAEATRLGARDRA